nr:MAG TPA: hypothetical protein [Caudoviricetes sp.]
MEKLPVFVYFFAKNRTAVRLRSGYTGACTLVYLQTSGHCGTMVLLKNIASRGIVNFST